MHKQNLFLMLTLFLASNGHHVAQAQEIQPINLTVSPISIRLEAQPGETVNSSIKIRNNGTSNEKLKINLGTFQADQTGEKPILIEPTEKDTFMNWLVLEQNEIEVFPGEWKEISFKIQVPNEAALAYYYLVYVTQSKFDTKLGETNLTGAPAISILLDVKSPNTRKELQLKEFRTKEFIVESLPKEFELEINNSGNTYASPMGNLFIDGQNQEDIAVLPINPKDNVILPGSTRTYQINWADGFPIKGNGWLGFDWNFDQIEKFRIGKYTANVLLVYDDGEKDIALESAIDFWVIPWKLILIAILVIILSSMGLWTSIKKPVNKTINIVKQKLTKQDLETNL